MTARRMPVSDAVLDGRSEASSGASRRVVSIRRCNARMVNLKQPFLSQFAAIVPQDAVVMYQLSAIRFQRAMPHA